MTCVFIIEKVGIYLVKAQKQCHGWVRKFLAEFLNLMFIHKVNQNSIAVRPDISIIIPVFNQWPYTRRCLSALSASKTNLKFEVWVVDDGSTDETIAEMESTNWPDFLNIHLLKMEINSGYAKANNAAIKRAKGRCILLLNNDVILPIADLERMLAVLDQNKQLGAVGPLLRYDLPFVQHAGIRLGHDGKHWIVFHQHRALPLSEWNQHRKWKNPLLTGACLLVKGEVFEAVGLLDTRFMNGYEDVDFGLRLRDKGFQTHLVDEVVLVHSESVSGNRLLFDEENYKRFVEKWGGLLEPEFSSEETVQAIRLNKERIRNMQTWIDETEAVSVIITLFNKADLTIQCLKSLEQTITTKNVEILLIDNASSDDTPTKIEEFIRHSQLDCRYIRNEENRNYAGGNNQGALLAKGERLIFLNNDTIAQPGWLEAMLPHLRPQSPVTIVGAQLWYEDDTIQHAGVIPWGGTPIHRFQKKPKSFPEAQKSGYLDLVTAACLGIRKADFLELGGFDESYINGFEDMDLCLRARCRNASVYYEAQAKLYHLESQSPGRNDHNLENIKLFFGKWANMLGHGKVINLPKLPINYGVEKSEIKEAGFCDFDVKERCSKQEYSAFLQGYAQIFPDSALKLAHLLMPDAPKHDEYDLLQGLVAFKLKNYTNAVRHLSRYNAKHPEQIIPNFVLAASLLSAGDLSGAESRLFQVLRMQPNHPQATYLLKNLPRFDRKGTTTFELKTGEDVNESLTRMPPKVSIIILTHNNWYHTQKCIASIERCTKVPYQIVFVDNASQDETVGRLKHYVRSHPNHRLILNQENKGFPLGNNLGLCLAEGTELICLLNNDTVVSPQWLERALLIGKEHEEIGVFGPVSNNVAGHQQTEPSQYSTFEAYKIFCERRWNEFGAKTIETMRVIGFCLFIKKEVVGAIGGLDPNFGIGNMEDDDFCLRAERSGWKIGYCPGIYIHHSGNQTFSTLDIDYERLVRRNWIYFCKKWGIVRKEDENWGGYQRQELTQEHVALGVEFQDLLKGYKKEGVFYQE